MYQSCVQKIMNQSVSEQQDSKRKSFERLRLTSRQHRILRVVSQGKPLDELAYDLGTSREAAQLLEDIAVKLNHRLDINLKSESQQDKASLIHLSEKSHISHTSDAYDCSDDENLTPRQCEILRLVANGLTTKEIAKSLFISVKTVETHRGQIMQRLNIHDLAGLIRHALRVGLISLDE